jgi:hypothetical protein
MELKIHINEVKTVPNAVSIALRKIMLSEDVRAGPWCGTTTGR